MSLVQKGCLRFLSGDQKGAAEMFLEAAKEGDAEAAFDYAFCLQNGYGVETDLSGAKTFYGFARDLPGGDACYNLAMLYMHGAGVKKDHKRAFYYMTDAADLGCVEAQLYLGMAYTTGTVFEPDIVGISRIPTHTPVFRSASGLLGGECAFDEADEEERSTVILADQRQAFSWFRTAALCPDSTYVEELVAKAQYLFAKCYLDGMGTDFNVEKATKIMLIAGRNGSEEALSFLAERGITKEMLFSAGEEKRGLLK